MEEEKIIRDEAKLLYKNEIYKAPITNTPIKLFQIISSRLFNFYSNEYKAIFLDEIQINILQELVHHRNKEHNGIASPDCRYETETEKLLFYINQELGTLPLVAHQKTILSSQQNRSKVFISYSHSDKEYLQDIHRHFKPFLNQIDFWDDTKIQPGQKWKEEIRRAINETKVAILLLSTDFFGSEFISSNELPPLLEAAENDGAIILIVILKPCLFEEFNALNQYQAMNSPDKPIMKMTDLEKEELYVNLVRQTKKFLDTNNLHK